MPKKSKSPPEKIQTNQKTELQINKIVQTYSELIGRAQLMARLGQHYGGDRDIYEALGYDLDPQYDDYAARYERQDIAAAVINRPIEVSWKGRFKVIENVKDREDEAKLTAFEQAWIDLDKERCIINNLIRLDRVSGLGRYGVLLLGLDDVKTIEDFIQPVKLGKRNLLYLKPLGEGNAEISTWEKNTNDARYGLPRTYQIKTINPGSESETLLNVHHTRILHISPSILLESDVYGVPRLKEIYNRLMDLEKLVGGSAEMFWRGARPGYQGKLDKDYSLSETQRDDLQDQVDEFENNLRRLFMNEGITLEALAQQIADPSKHVDIQIQMISAAKSIPKRVLTGTERGELSSTEDRDTWLETNQNRREEYLERCIVRKTIDRFIELGILPAPKFEYSIHWADLYAKGEKDKAEIGKIRSESLANYTRSPYTQEVIVPEDFFKFFLGFNDDQLKRINKSIQEVIKLEDDEIKDDNKDDDEIIDE